VCSSNAIVVGSALDTSLAISIDSFLQDFFAFDFIKYVNPNAIVLFYVE
jgi:hypothetical protein